MSRRKINRSETGSAQDAPMVIRGTMQETPEGQIRRSSERFTLNLEAEGGGEAGDGYPVMIHNLSASGVLIETEAELAIGRELRIALPEAGEVVAIVVWNSEHLFGCRFQTPLSQSALSAARLRNPLPTDFDPSRAAIQPGLAIGLQIRRLREERGLSLSALGRRAGLSKPSIWAWETGKSLPRRRSLDQLAAALDVSVDEIMGNAALSSIAPDDPDAPGQETSSGLRAEIDTAKRRIARAAGVTTANVKVIVEL